MSEPSSGKKTHAIGTQNAAAATLKTLRALHLAPIHPMGSSTIITNNNMSISYIQLLEQMVR